MNASCFRYEHGPDGQTSIYLGETTTAECLRVFDDRETVVVMELGAEIDRKWVTADSFPKNANVAFWLAILSDESFSLVDFTANLSGVTISTHDDGEATLRFAEFDKMREFLFRLIGPASAERIISVLLANVGCYIAPSGESFRVYTSFDAYLAGA